MKSSVIVSGATNGYETVRELHSTASPDIDLTMPAHQRLSRLHRCNHRCLRRSPGVWRGTQRF
jgi:hypothetical protein